MGTTDQSLREKRHGFLLRMCSRSLIMREHHISPKEEGLPAIFQMLKVMRVKETQGSYHRCNKTKEM